MIESLLNQMAGVGKPQRQFLLVLLMLLSGLRGRANFRNLSRYRDYHEKTFSRWSRRGFDFVEFNRWGLEMTVEPETVLIGAMDGSFIPKSGKHPEGLGKFDHGSRGKAEKGLEISTLAGVNVTENTAYNLSTRQTPATMKNDESRVDFYLEHLKPDRESLAAQIRY